jgi:hypothetical protein
MNNKCKANFDRWTDAQGFPVPTYITEVRALLTALQEDEQRLRSLAAIVESSDDAYRKLESRGRADIWELATCRKLMPALALSRHSTGSGGRPTKLCV